MITKSELVFLGVGIIVHAGFLATAQRAKMPVYHYPDAPITYVDIEVDPAKEQTHEDAENPLSDREVATNATPRATHGGRGALNLPQTKGASGDKKDSTPSEPGSLTTDHPPDEYDDPEGAFTMAPGTPGATSRAWELPDGNEIGGNGPPAPTEAPKTKKVDRGKANDVLAAAIKEKDKGLGLQLPAAGTVASTLRDAVWSSDLPETGSGVFVVVIGADGKVSSVKVAQMAGGTSAQWDAAAANAKASLAARGLKLSDEYKKGAIVTVSVLSKMQNPSGTDPDSPVKFGTTTTFDISDLGAKPIRQVRITGTNVTPVK